MVELDRRGAGSFYPDLRTNSRLILSIVESGERREDRKEADRGGLIVSGISNWPVAISCERKPVRRPARLTSIFSLSLSLSLSLSFSLSLVVRLSIPAASYLLSLLPHCFAVLGPLSVRSPRPPDPANVPPSTFFAPATSLSLRCISVFTRRTYCDCDRRPLYAQRPSTTVFTEEETSGLLRLPRVFETTADCDEQRGILPP